VIDNSLFPGTGPESDDTITKSPLLSNVISPLFRLAFIYDFVIFFLYFTRCLSRTLPIAAPWRQVTAWRSGIAGTTFYYSEVAISAPMADIAVYVDSRGGNTRKVADAIAKELGVTVGNITTSPPDDATTLFLGSGTYGGRPGEGMMKFIGAGTFTGRKVALFGTSAAPAGSEKMIAVMADALTQKGAAVVGTWHCGGKFLVLNWGRPSTQDLDNAKKFANEMLSLR
jgi:flavodoxin